MEIPATVVDIGDTARVVVGDVPTAIVIVGTFFVVFVVCTVGVDVVFGGFAMTAKKQIFL